MHDDVIDPETGTILNRHPDGRFTEDQGEGRFRPWGQRQSKNKQKFLTKIINKILDEDLRTHPDKMISGLSEHDEQSIADKALKTIFLACGQRDPGGQVTPVALDAAKDIMDRRWGRPRQQVDITVSDNTLINMMNETSTARLIEMGRRRQLMASKGADVNDNGHPEQH